MEINYFQCPVFLVNITGLFPMALNEGCHAVLLLIREHSVMKDTWLPVWWIGMCVWPFWIKKQNKYHHHRPKSQPKSHPNTPQAKQTKPPNHKQLTHWFCTEGNSIRVHEILQRWKGIFSREQKRCCFCCASHGMISDTYTVLVRVWMSVHHIASRGGEWYALGTVSQQNLVLSLHPFW